MPLWEKLGILSIYAHIYVIHTFLLQQVGFSTLDHLGKQHESLVLFSTVPDC